MKGVKEFTVKEHYIKVVYIVDGEEITIKFDTKNNEAPQKLQNAVGAFIGVLEDVGRTMFEKGAE
jgi:hypothetical protein